MNMREIEGRVANWVVDHPWPVIAATLILFVFSAFGIYHIKIDSDLRIFFSEDNPRLLELEALEKTFTKNETIIFVIVPDNGDVFTSRNLKAVEDMTAAAWKMPFSSRVDSLTNFQYSHANDDVLIVEDFITNAGSMDAPALAQKKSLALQEPLLINRVVSPAGDATGIFVTTIFDRKQPDDVAAVAQFARGMASEYEQQYPGLSIYLTGSVMFDTAFSEVSRHDMSILAPAMFLVLVVMIGIALRSWLSTFLTAVIIILATLTALGLAGWLGISINPASANAPTIILTLAVAHSVHILVMFNRKVHGGEEKITALVETLKVNLQAMFLTSLTTAVGFLTMNFSDAPPFHGLGNIVAIGVGAAFIYSIMLLPALLVVLPVNVRYAPLFSDINLFKKLVTFVNRRQGIIIITLLSVAILLGSFAFQNRLNDNWIGYFASDLPVRVATAKLQERLSGSDFVEYSVPARGQGGINEPEYLRNLDKFVGWLREQEVVRSVIAIPDIIKRLNRNMHEDNPEWYRIPGSRELAAQYLLIYEMSLPLGLDLNNLISIDKSTSRVVISVENRGTAGLRQFDREVQQWLNGNVPDYMYSRGSGMSVVWASISEQNIRSMLTAAFGALLAISIIFLLTLRRLDMALISVVPNITPAMCAFGIWMFFVGEVGLGLSVVVSMTLGIVVDDTVHFISKYLRARDRHGMAPEKAIEFTFHIAGSAMWVTTVALVSGFMVLTFSDYKLSADMGLLSAVTIAIALLMDFVLLPALLMKIDRRQYEGIAANTTVTQK